MRNILRISGVLGCLCLVQGVGATELPIEFVRAEDRTVTRQVVVPKFTEVNDELRQFFAFVNGAVQQLNEMRQADVAWTQWVSGAHTYMTQLLASSEVQFMQFMVDTWRKGICDLLSEPREREDEQPQTAVVETADEQSRPAQAVAEEPSDLERFKSGIEKACERFKERAPRELQRLGEQANALLARAQDRLPVELKRVENQISKFFGRRK